MMTGIAVVIGATPENIFSEEIGNDIMMSRISSATNTSLDAIINGSNTSVSYNANSNYWL